MPTGKKTTIEELKNKIITVHGDSVKVDESTYKNTITKCVFIHKIYGPWETLPSSVLRGCTHPKVGSNNRKITKEDFKKRIYDIHGDSVTLEDSTFIGMNEKCTFIHKSYGKWQSLPMDILKGSTHRGVSSQRRRLTKDQVDMKLKEAHGDNVSIIWETYINVDTPCKFVHKKYGEWIAMPCNVFSGNGPTKLRKHKTASTSTESFIKIHWKTGEELICQASWEPKVVDYLNSNKIRYLWQPQIFKTPLLTPKGKNSTYRPDIYLIDSNKWIEIKGYFRKDAKEKWDWFQSEYPNSELWDKKKLKELGIL